MEIDWHYVRDGELPEENKGVLISVRGKHEVMIGYYFEEHGWKDADGKPRFVYAWAYLPETAPKKNDPEPA